MCHTVNMAVQQVIATGFPLSVSVMVACPWFPEAVDILKQHPEVAVGVHLTLNAEWKDYRWGPVAGSSAVPSLVDSNGWFFPSRDLFFAHNPKREQVEQELRAQIDRAMRSGLRIDYLDYHMGTAVSTPELRLLVEQLATEYHLGVSRYFGEADAGGWYAVSPEHKLDSLMAVTNRITPESTWLMVFHTGLDTPEMQALVDLNAFGLTEMSRHRAAELRALTSQEFRNLLEERHLQPITYRDLIEKVGLRHMTRPDAEY